MNTKLTYEQRHALIELGCEKNIASVATFQDATTFLREKDLHVVVDLFNEGWEYLITHVSEYPLYRSRNNDDIHFTDHSQALSAGITKALEILKKMKENNH